ncbi:9648_t:CDS:2, partial [Racocetra persica]
LPENVRCARRNGNNALYEALELNVVGGLSKKKNSSLETELDELRSNVVTSVQDGWMLEQWLRARLANDEEELRRLRAEKRRREGNNNNRDRISGF